VTLNESADGRQRVLAAVKAVWAEWQEAYGELPDVRVRWDGRPSRRSAAVAQHLRAGDWDNELVLTDERVDQGAVALIVRMRHEFAHGLAGARGVRDTSRDGRHHNAKYRDLAAELQLELSEDDGGAGSTCASSETVQAWLATPAGAALQAAVDDYQPTPGPGHAPRRGGGQSEVAKCGCVGDVDRPMRMSAKKFALGPVICGICGQHFELVDQR
jgi:hypothetical protein